MFENKTMAYADAKKKVRYEPIERRKINRRSAASDRRSEQRVEDESAERRHKSDRRKK